MFRRNVLKSDINFDKEKRLKNFVEKVISIHDMNDEQRIKYKTKTTCDNEKRFLKTKALAYSTEKQIYKEYRDALVEANIFNGSYEENVSKFLKKYPDHGYLFTDSVKETITNIKKLRKSLKSGGVKNNGVIDSSLYETLGKIKIASNAYYSMKFSKTKSALLKAKVDSGIKTRKHDPMDINIGDVEECAKRCIKGKSMYKMALGLILCSGRRPYELFATARFEKVDNSTVKFFGQAKDKGTGVRDGYEIPILFVSVDEFLSAFEVFRNITIDKGYEGLTSTQVNSRLGKELSKVARRELDNEHITFYTCRSIYANSAVFLTKPKVPHKLISEILGHSEEDDRTVDSYECVSITRKQVEKTRYVKPKKLYGFGKAQAIADKKQAIEDSKPQPKNSKRLAKFKAMDQVIMNESKAMQKLHAWVTDYITYHPSQEITQTWVLKNRSTSVPLLKRYIEILSYLAKG